MNRATPTVVVWAEQGSPRLRYVLDWLLGERLGLSYRLTADRDEAAAAPHCIAYGFLESAVSIHATSLLWETGISRQEITTSEWQGLHTLFFDEGSPCDIQFDMLAGVFYLLSRYEEYLPFTPDRHNRFPPEQSVLFPVLERPVADEWVEALRQFLEQVWNISIPQKPFSFQPTYDIDIAWSFLFKGWKRALGAGLKHIARGDWKALRRRLRVSRGLEQDPYDSFVWIFTQHMDSAKPPHYFVLAALAPSRFDKNIPPRHPRMSSLIKAFSTGAQVGLHPSYYADVRPEKQREEKAVLEAITGKPVVISRQHFIRLRFPQTYRALFSAGITDDYSMGYSTQLGFRAGTGSPFLWYDLMEESATPLRIHPFVFMDSTAHYYLHLSAGEAFNRLRQMAAKLQACGSRVVTIMHNYSLGADEEWKGWRRAYEQFLRDINQQV